jgi:hypothetical protein
MHPMKYISILLILFTFSCKNADNITPFDDPKAIPEKTFKINTEVNQYFDFKLGSWWLYKDNVTGKTDCLYVTDNFNYYRLVPETNKGRVTLFNWKFETNSISYNLQTVDTVIKHTTMITVDSVNTITNTDFLGFLDYVALKYNGSTFSLDSTKYSILSQTNQTLDSIKYNNTLSINNINNASDSLRLIISKNIGIVKYYKRVSTKSIMNISLLKYHIVQ